MFTLAAAASLHAGALIDLRPTPSQPPGGYAPNTILDVGVFLVDTGNPQGDIPFRGLQLDFADTTGTLGFPGTDRMPGTPDDNLFNWILPDPGLGFVDPTLPTTFWAFDGNLIQFAITLPNDGEMQLGSILVDVGSSGGLLDVVNADEPQSLLGASASGGFFGDPLFEWRTYSGDLTGGRLDIAVVPEPTTFALCAAALLGLAARRIYRAL